MKFSYYLLYIFCLYVPCGSSIIFFPPLIVTLSGCCSSKIASCLILEYSWLITLSLGFRAFPAPSPLFIYVDCYSNCCCVYLVICCYLFSVLLYLCSSVGVVDACVHMLKCTHPCWPMWRSTVDIGISSSIISPTLLFETGISLNWDHSISARLLGHRTSRMILSPSSSAGIKHTCFPPIPAFLCGCGDLNSDAHACTENTYPVSVSPRSPLLFCFVSF